VVKSRGGFVEKKRRGQKHPTKPTGRRETKLRMGLGFTVKKYNKKKKMDHSLSLTEGGKHWGGGNDGNKGEQRFTIERKRMGDNGKSGRKKKDRGGNGSNNSQKKKLTKIYQRSRVRS